MNSGTKWSEGRKKVESLALFFFLWMGLCQSFFLANPELIKQSIICHKNQKETFSLFFVEIIISSSFNSNPQSLRRLRSKKSYEHSIHFGSSFSFFHIHRAIEKRFFTPFFSFVIDVLYSPSICLFGQKTK